MKKAVIYSILIVATCAFVMRLIINKVSAAETIVISQPYHNIDSSGQTIAQSFTISSATNISGVKFLAQSVVDLNVAICSGDIASDNASSTDIWQKGASTCGSTNLRITETSCTTQAGTTTCPFSWTYNLEPDNYYIKWYTNEFENLFDNKFADSDKYDGGNIYRWDDGYSTGDMAFQIYYDDTFDVWDPAMDPTLNQTIPDFASVYNMTCIIGEICKMWFSFTPLAIGYDVYLFDRDVVQIPGNEIASTTITASPLWQNYVVVPNETTSGTYEYSLLLQADEWGWTFWNNEVYWISSSEWQEIMDDKFGWMSDPCYDVATSSGTYSDDFRYGVECGFRKFMGWLIYPSDETMNDLELSIGNFKNNFPLSSWYLIQDFIDSASTSLSRGDGVNIPFALWQDKSMANPEPIAYMSLTTTTISQYIDDDTYSNFYNFMTVLVYLGGLGYVIWRLFSLNRAGQ